MGSENSAVFRVLSLVIAAACCLKAAIALAIPGRFYGERRRQYLSPSPPAKVVAASVVVLGLAAASWYAAAFHYRPWGWIVTACLTALASGSVTQFLRWERHRRRMLTVVVSPRVWIVDCLLLIVSAAFLALGVLVY